MATDINQGKPKLRHRKTQPNYDEHSSDEENSQTLQPVENKNPPHQSNCTMSHVSTQDLVDKNIKEYIEKLNELSHLHHALSSQFLSWNKITEEKARKVEEEMSLINSERQQTAGEISRLQNELEKAKEEIAHNLVLFKGAHEDLKKEIDNLNIEKNKSAEMINTLRQDFAKHIVNRSNEKIEDSEAINKLQQDLTKLKSDSLVEQTI